MRNLASGNKVNFTIFAFVVILILVILVCAVTIVLRYDKTEYEITSAAFIYDDKYNYIELENDGIISQKWTGNYYLKEDITDKEYELGKYAISYDTNRRTLDLFGNFYQVFKGGDITKFSGYTTINGSAENRFYKIDDRKYLIIGQNIENDTGSLSAEDYLIVIIDKLGNSLLLNNKINVKTINEMIISTSSFSFDVANELLIFNEDEKIDLKKIIGSTNEYVTKENEGIKDENEEENVETAESEVTSINNSNIKNNNSSTIIANGNDSSELNGSESTDKSWKDSFGNWAQNVAGAFESIYDKDKSNKDKNDSSVNRSVALNSINLGTTFIDINYTINDPQNTYNVVYAIVSNQGNSRTISLDKNANTYRVTGLNPNTQYTVEIGNKIIYSDATSKDTIEDAMLIKTLKPTESISFTKVSLNRVYYTLKLDGTFLYDAGAKIAVYINDQKQESLGVTLSSADLEQAARNGYTGSFKIPENYNSNIGTAISLVLENTKYNNQSVTNDVKARIINY